MKKNADINAKQSKNSNNGLKLKLADSALKYPSEGNLHLVLFILDHKKTERIRYKSLDLNQNETYSKISKVYKPKEKEDEKNTSLNKSKDKPLSLLRAPTTVVNRKVVNLKAGKITTGNQPNQRRGRIIN